MKQLMGQKETGQMLAAGEADHDAEFRQQQIFKEPKAEEDDGDADD